MLSLSVAFFVDTIILLHVSYQLKCSCTLVCPPCSSFVALVDGLNTPLRIQQTERAGHSVEATEAICTTSTGPKCMLSNTCETVSPQFAFGIQTAATS
jgi:hypothetical protein